MRPLGDPYEDYEGKIRCWVCHAVLQVTLREGQLRSLERSTGTSALQPDAGTSRARSPTFDSATNEGDQEAR